MTSKSHKPIRRIAVVGALHKRGAPALVRDLVGWLADRGVETRLQRSLAERLRREDLAFDDDLLMRGASLALSLGGDGTMLATARLAAPRGIPILGCNLGGFGFMTELARSDLMAVLPEVLAGRYSVRDRMMVEGEMMRDGTSCCTVLALNDIIIMRGALSRLLRLEIDVGSEQLGLFSADGVIVSTPTGSTAYSLSAGGPVISPDVEALIVTPVCAHTLSARPVVVPSGQEISVSVSEPQPGQEVMVAVDGQVGFALEPDDVMRVRKARVAAHIVQLGGPSFLVKVRTKLGWAGRS
jgi:NAD+ kinase